MREVKLNYSHALRLIPLIEKEVAQDKDKESSSSSSTAKRSHILSSDSTKKDKGEKLEISGASKMPDKRTRIPESLPAKPVQPSPSLPLDLSTKKDVYTDIDEDDKENVKAQNGSSDILDSSDSPRPKTLSSQSPPLRKKGSRSLGSMHITPKKRNRRQSADSNSSLSSPPSSSEPDSDIDDRMAEGGRAKKVVKKANREMDSTGEADHSAFGNHSLDSIDTLSDAGVNSSMDIDPVTSVKLESTEGKDVEMATDQEFQKPKLTELMDDSQLEPEPPTTDSIATPEVNSPEATVKKEHQVSELSRDRPSTKDTSQGSTSTSGTSSAKDNQKPTPLSSPHKKEPESDRARSSSGSSSHRPGPPLKRTHTPKPLPPRPNIVPLPPKPTIKPGSSLSRRTSHSRKSSATATSSATVTNPNTHSGSKSPSSGTNASSATAGSSASTSLPSLSTSGSSGSTSRHHSFSGRGGDSHPSGSHGHQVHPLPPPPHHLQHPLPPTPRPGLTTSRSTPHLNTKTGQVHSQSRPNISTSPSFHSPPTTSSSTTPTTPHSANITSPDSTKSPQEPLNKESKELKESKDRLKEIEVAVETLRASSPAPITENNSQLKSPGSNSSSDSISSTGSLSTTGSTSGTAELLSPKIAMETASQPPAKSPEAVTRPKEQTKEAEPITASTPPPTNELKESDLGNSLPSSPGSMSTSSLQPTSLASIREEPASGDQKPGRPRLSSSGSSDSHVPHSGVPRSSSLSSVPKSHSGSVSSPPAHPLTSKSHALSSSSSTSASSPSSGGSHKLKPIGRTPIPLPHKPIPLPPKPSLSGSASTGSPPTSSSINSKHRRK